MTVFQQSLLVFTALAVTGLGGWLGARAVWRKGYFDAMRDIDKLEKRAQFEYNYPPNLARWYQNQATHPETKH